MNESRRRAALRVPALSNGGGRACDSGKRVHSSLYIYDPFHGERVTIDDELKIDPLVAASDTDELVIRTGSATDERSDTIRTPFRKRYVLRDIIPRGLWPGRSNPEQQVSISLTLQSRDGRRQSQAGHAFVLVRDKAPATECPQRQHCQIAWTRGRLGGMNAAPCRHMVRKFHCPFHDKAAEFDPWNSDTMIALRESLVTGRNKYCFHGCPNYSADEPREFSSRFVGDPLIKANIELARREYLEGRTRLESKPIVLALKMGSACDNYCTFCSIHETTRPFTISGRSLELAHEWFPYARQVIFTGGEPLVLHKFIRRIISRQPPQEGKVVRFCTNGILLKDRLDLLDGFSNLTLSVSLNTPCPETYARLHGTDSFDKVLEGIGAVRQARPGLTTQIHLKMIVMRSTHRQIHDFARLAADLGADQVGFRHLRWYKRLRIDVGEKLMPGDPARDEAFAAVGEATEFLKSAGVKVVPFFLDARADDVT